MTPTEVLAKQFGGRASAYPMSSAVQAIAALKAAGYLIVREDGAASDLNRRIRRKVAEWKATHDRTGHIAWLNFAEDLEAELDGEVPDGNA